ncbi:hypothetical protein BT63DRAFT_424927 [Microthyrium microscopicum]|uniref:Uncharacterized protein n=1 Tax=Microthyrium microscopicum TaxID=703497 RepID=A0A6A6UAB4_9PEZI|nr:hypothetical protein BT63DRAFT_424927 [Microthyrium microscopicum]
MLGSLITSLVGPAKPGQVAKSLKAQYDPKATREFKLWGPYSLPGKNATHAGPGFSNGIKLDPSSDVLNGWISPPCTDCTVLKAVANLAYKNGTQADVGTGVYTHHIIISQVGRPQLIPPIFPVSCNSSLSGAKPSTAPKQAGGSMAGHGHRKRQDFTSSVFVGGGGSAGSGSAFAAPNSDIKTGAYIGKYDAFQFSSEIVNYNPKEKEIYLSLDYEFLPGKTPGLMNVGMGALSVEGCAGPTAGFMPPADKPIKYTGSEYIITENGYFVNWMPHLHDGGEKINIFLNGKDVCETKAVYGSDSGSEAVVGGSKWETISSYIPCEKAIAFKKGDKLKMTADYDLTKHRLRPDSAHSDMGAEGMALANFIWAKAV